MMACAFDSSSKRGGIVSRQRFVQISKEIFRKTIHLCSATIPFIASKSKSFVMIALCCALVVYSISEWLRLKGKEVFMISAITEAAARKRDENRFVLGPVTLVAGILCALFLWQPLPASIGIYALAFGDGLASLVGKVFGRVKVPLTQGKTAIGSLACFTAIFVSSFLAMFFSSYVPQGADITFIALKVAALGMIIEMLPLKDFDNILIPIVLGGFAQSQLLAM